MPSHYDAPRCWRREILVPWLLAWAVGATRLVLASGEASHTVDASRTFALETFAHRSLNYLNRMVDTNGLPYFNIFWTEDGTVSVHLHFDKLLPQAQIRGYQPFQGQLTIRLNTECNVRVRIPDFLEPGALKVEKAGAAIPVRRNRSTVDVDVYIE